MKGGIRYGRDGRRNVKKFYWCEIRGSISLLLYLSFSPSLPPSISLFLSPSLSLSFYLPLYLSLYTSLTLLYPSHFIILNITHNDLPMHSIHFNDIHRHSARVDFLLTQLGVHFLRGQVGWIWGTAEDNGKG